MSYVSEKIRYEFESIPINLKHHILENNVQLNNISDLINALNDVISEGESPKNNEIKSLAQMALTKIQSQPITGDQTEQIIL